MALIYEVVKEEDRELFNSFVPSRKANRNTMWVADKERNIYFFWIGGETRENIYEYFLSCNNLKIYIYTEERCGNEAHIWINQISMPKVLENNKEKLEEIVDIIKNVIDVMFEDTIVVFERIVNPTFRKGDN